MTKAHTRLGVFAALLAAILVAVGAMNAASARTLGSSDRTGASARTHDHPKPNGHQQAQQRRWCERHADKWAKKHPSRYAARCRPTPPTPHRLMDIQMLSFNDFHGNLEPPTGSSANSVTGHTVTNGAAADVNTLTGGAAYLATHLNQARAGHPNTITVAAGDIVGASPLLSAAFHDEPTIEAMNSLGLAATAVGNHEFDEGYRELQRLQYGGCIDDGDGRDNQNSCASHTFTGADFDILAANVKYAGTNRTILPGYTIKNVNGARIAFIGMTLRQTPDIVTASGIAGLEFSDEVATANALVPEIQAKGVQSIVVLIHQGGTPDKQQWTDPASGKTFAVNPTYDYTCGGGGTLAASSPILPIAAQLSPAIDMVVSGHTHQPYVCDVVDPAGQSRLVTSASSFGRLFTDTELKYDTVTKDIVRTSVKGANMLVTRDVTPDPSMLSLIDAYKTLIGPIQNRVIGHITADVTNVANALGESPLGDLIADAQLADASVVGGKGTPQIAFMNPGGIRGSLSKTPDGAVTFGAAFAIQPFNNYLVSMTLTGQQIYDVLRQQVTGANAASKRILQISQGFSYTADPVNGAVDGSVTLNGTPIDKAANYRIVTNNFLSDGGDGFAAFKTGADKYFGGLDIDAFANYLTAHDPYTPLPADRIK